MVKKIRAAVFEDIQKIVYKDDYPKPEINEDETLVKVHYCAICGSDITNFKYKMYNTPLILGHEFSGIVEQTGKNVFNFKKGDKVVGVNIIPEGNYGKIRGMGVFRDGGFADYVKVHKDDLFGVPDSLSLLECSLIEAFAVSTRAIKLSKIEEKQNIAIIGGGNIGLTTLSVLNATKMPNYTLVIEPHEFLRKKAIDFGATDALPPNKAKLRNYFKKNGEPTYIFECAGNEAAIKLSIDLIKHGGSIILGGIVKGNISFPIFLLNNKEITLKGSISHNKQDVLDAIDLLKKKKISAEPFISEIISLKDIQKGFERFLESGERNFIKIVVEI